MQQEFLQNMPDTFMPKMLLSLCNLNRNVCHIACWAASGTVAVIGKSQKQAPCADMHAGAIYAMNVVPCASTLCVVNIRQTDAKVEAILSDYIQLGQEVGQSSTQVGLLYLLSYSLCITAELGASNVP